MVIGTLLNGRKCQPEFTLCITADCKDLVVIVLKSRNKLN